MRITRRSAVPLIGLGLTGAWPNSGKVYPPGATSAAAGFNPTSLITGAGGFWRADAGVTGNPSVTQWNDQSSFASNLTLNSSQTSPQFSSTGFNGAKPGLTFDTSLLTDGLSFQWTGGGFTSTTLTIFILIEFFTGSPTSFGRFSSFSGNGNANDFDNTSSFAQNDAVGANAYAMNFNGGIVGNGGASGPSLTNNGLFLLGTVFDGVNANTWTAGSVLGSGSAVSSTLGAGTTWFSVGCGETNTGSLPAAHFVLAFAGLTQKAMNSTDWGNLKTWTNSNWGTSF